MKSITLTPGKFALVDDADFDWLNKFHWYSLKSTTKHKVRWYAIRKTPRHNYVHFTVFMHRQILGLEHGTNCDHRNGNGLDNRRENLRPCSQSQNGANSRKQPGTSSRFKGVDWHKHSSKWRARIGVGGRLILLGYFSDQSIAAAAYDLAAQHHFGEFALTNKAMQIS